MSCRAHPTCFHLRGKGLIGRLGHNNLGAQQCFYGQGSVQVPWAQVPSLWCWLANQISHVQPWQPQGKHTFWLRWVSLSFIASSDLLGQNGSDHWPTPKRIGFDPVNPVHVFFSKLHRSSRPFQVSRQHQNTLVASPRPPASSSRTSRMPALPSKSCRTCTVRLSQTAG